MAGAGPRQGADMEDEEPDGDAVRGGLLPGVPAEGEHEGRRARAGGESRRAAGVLGAAGVPGALIPVLIGSLEDAAKATEAGVDGIVVQGCEAEGLVIGQEGLLPLLPKVVDLVSDSDTTIITAGGIVDGRGYVALALGAQGVCLGTRLFSLSVLCRFLMVPSY